MMWRTALLTILFSAVVALTVGVAAVYLGVYNVAATEQHTLPVYQLFEVVMRQSVRANAHDITPPDLNSPEMLTRGLRLYREHCAQCHGAPGVARDALGMGMTPVPVNLAQTGRDWPAAHIYWVIKYGIKMTGMPAWKYRMSEEDLWATTAFVKQLPAISPAAYESMLRELASAESAQKAHTK